MPADIRVDAGGGHLYIKQSGRDAVFGRMKIVLVEYDLVARQQTEAISVEPQGLPEECPANGTARR